MMIRPALAATAAGLLLLTACGSSEVAGPQPTATVTVTHTVTATPEVVEGEPTGETPEGGTSIATWGESVTLPDGEGTITIGAPQPFTPSESAAFDEWPEYVVFEVTEVNDGTEPAPAGWSLTATTGDQEATQVFDSAQGIEVATATVMPGKSITYKVAFGRTPGEDFVLTARPLGGWGAAYFQ